MTESPRQEIAAALHLIQREIAMEANRVERVTALLREYLDHPSRPSAPPGATRLGEIERDLRRFAAGCP